MPKVPGSRRKSEERPRHNPLAEEYAPSEPTKQKAPKRRKVTQDDEDPTVNSKASKKILKIGQDLVEEIDQEQEADRPNPAFAFDSRPDENVEEETYEGYENEEAWGSDEEVVEEEVDPDDQDIFDRFNPSNADPSLDPNNLSFDQTTKSKPPDEDGEQGGGTDLASLILSKIEQHEATQSGQAPPPDFQEDNFPFDEPPPLPPKAIEVYKTIGQLLSRQRSGPLPKPFKILPSLPPHQIPQLLDITSPISWTPYVHYMSTRLFISAKPAIAQPYLTEILLPSVRDAIHETKKLHSHTYNALKRALYKPACFFKGLLFPLLESGTCTLREAHIISSALSRVRVPVLHSAAALLRLCEMGAEMFTASARTEDRNDGPVNIFIRCLLDKKYALPFKVVDALVFHFVRFKALDPAAAEAEDANMGNTRNGGDVNVGDEGKSAFKLTVLWHQSLLSFAQRYRNDITEDQREALLDLVNVRGHKQIGPEVRRELLEGRGRGVPADEGAGGVDVEGGDDTMVM